MPCHASGCPSEQKRLKEREGKGKTSCYAMEHMHLAKHMRNEKSKKGYKHRSDEERREGRKREGSKNKQQRHTAGEAIDSSQVQTCRETNIQVRRKYKKKRRYEEKTNQQRKA